MNAEAFPPQRVTLMQDDPGEDGPMPMHTDGIFVPDGWFTTEDVVLLIMASVQSEWLDRRPQMRERWATLAARLEAVLPPREIDWHTDGSD
jgi:hypothetical protein